MKNGKPGEIWRAIENTSVAPYLPPQWADWLILDGDLLITAHELGYKGDLIACCIALGGGDRTSVISMASEELYAVDTVDKILHMDRRNNTIWTRK